MSECKCTIVHTLHSKGNLTSRGICVYIYMYWKVLESVLIIIIIIMALLIYNDNNPIDIKYSFIQALMASNMW